MQENLTQESRIPLPENIGKKCNTITNKMWLSYIIPLYNCGEYIAKCLDSVLAQGLERDEYEVIVINDGSTDNGEEIVDKYCQKYDNFQLINKENGGVSSARNRGIDEARGEYIYFMDADDYLLPKGMKTLKDEYVEMYGYSDVISFNFHMVNKQYNPLEWESIHPHKMYFQGSFLEYGNKHGISSNVCFSIISRELITDFCVRFQPYVMSEDTFFMINLFNLAPQSSIIATDLNIYRYCVRGNSAMRNTDKKHIERLFYGYIDMVKNLEQMKETSPYDNCIFDRHTIWFKGEAFVRVLHSSFSYNEIKEMLAKASENNFYPIKPTVTNIQKLINICYQYPSMTYILSVIYRCIYHPFIKPLRLQKLFLKSISVNN